MNLILSNPTDHELEDLQLADEHGALMVSNNTRATEEDLLDDELQNFHWHEETIASKCILIILVTIDGLIIFLFWLVNPGNWEMIEVFNHVPKLDASLHFNYYFIIPLAPKAPFRTIDYILTLNYLTFLVVISSAGSFGGNSF